MWIPVNAKADNARARALAGRYRAASDSLSIFCAISPAMDDAFVLTLCQLFSLSYDDDDQAIVV